MEADLTLVISDLNVDRAGSADDGTDCFVALDLFDFSSPGLPCSSRASSIAAFLTRKANSDPGEAGIICSANKLCCFFGVMNRLAGWVGLGVRDSTLSGMGTGVLALWWTTAVKDRPDGGGGKVSLKLVGTE